MSIILPEVDRLARRYIFRLFRSWFSVMRPALHAEVSLGFPQTFQESAGVLP